MDIKEYLSVKAYIRYEQIIKELNKPVKFFKQSIDGFGSCGNFGNEYRIYISEKINNQDDMDHNFLHECLHLKQIKKGVPDAISIIDNINAEGIKEFCIELNSTFLDIPVEAKLKRWGFTNELVVRERLKNFKEKLENYEVKYNCDNDYIKCMLSINYALCLMTYSANQIINLNKIMKKYDMIVSTTNKIVKILKMVNFNDSNSIGNGMIKVIKFLNITDKVKIVNYKK